MPAWAPSVRTTESIDRLEHSDFRAVGCEAVESENDADYTKRGRSTCTHDLIMDLVPGRETAVTRSRPRNLPDGDEGAFLALVADAFLNVGSRRADRWRSNLRTRLRASAFLAAPPSPTVEPPATTSGTR